MMDAHNLGWKLASVVAGRSPEALLDSYGEEREPVAVKVLSLSHALVRFGTLKSPLQRALRDSLLPLAARSRWLRQRAARRLTQVGFDYRSSPLTQEDGAGGVHRPGDRMPDPEVACGGRRVRLYELLRHRRHVLLVPEADRARVLASPEIAPYLPLLTVATGDSAGGSWATLVRPDGYVAARARLDRPGRRDRMEKLFA